MNSAAVVALFLVSVAGALGAQDAARGKPGSAFVLKAGEAIRIAEENLVIRFDGVSEDSRCPVGVQCAWAGDAVVELGLEKPPEPARTVSLHTNARFGSEAQYSGLVIRLVGLEPHPRDGATIAPEAYRVTLIVERKALR